MLGIDSQQGETTKHEERKYKTSLDREARNRKSSSRNPKDQTANERTRDARHPTKPSEPGASEGSIAILYESRGLLNGTCSGLCDCKFPDCTSGT